LNDDDSCLRIDVLDHCVDEYDDSLHEPLDEELLTIESGDMQELEHAQNIIIKPNGTDRYNKDEKKAFEQLRKESRPSIEVPPKLDLKSLPSHLRYVFLGKSSTLPIIISAHLTKEEEEELLNVLRRHIRALGWSIADIKGISHSFRMHKILMEDFKPSIEHQRRLNPNMQEVVRVEIIKWLDDGIIYPISDSNWVSPIQVVPKKGGMTVVKNENNELIPTKTVIGWRVCIDYRKLKNATRKDHFPLPFID